MRLQTTYLGLELKNPLVPSASPLSREIGTIRQLEDAGAAAVVMYSLFEEQITREDEELEHIVSSSAESFAEAVTFFPPGYEFTRGPEHYLEHLHQAKAAVDIPIIASLNGCSPGGWVDYARHMQDAGADALELNIYHPPSRPEESGAEMEEIYIRILAAVKRQVSIPVSMKLGPYFSSLPAMVRRLEETGLDGLVIFNRFFQPDINLEELEVIPSIHLSVPNDIRMALRWIAVLSGSFPKLSFGATTGVHSAGDVLKLVMTGADVTMLCSALLKYGVNHISTILNDMRIWMDENEYDSIDQMKDSMNMLNVADPEAFMRANYMKGLNSYHG